ncbi:unnamed protein product [Symbiodinium pilosum]|uniref:Uncharacterized protein n=1 Tax=Symbiodinium pilosum TaxID=2952 RepID=A0A812R811_SYMPI|nr:unnamed protein product [Symbiodinium pilosum]
MSYSRVYSKSELRPFDVMVAWQLVNGKGQAEAFAIAATISSRGRTKPASSLTKKEKKERDKMWQDKFDKWKAALKERGWNWVKLRAKVRSLKKDGMTYEAIKKDLGVKTKA